MICYGFESQTHRISGDNIIQSHTRSAIRSDQVTCGFIQCLVMKPSKDGDCLTVLMVEKLLLIPTQNFLFSFVHIVPWPPTSFNTNYSTILFIPFQMKEGIQQIQTFVYLHFVDIHKGIACTL